MVALGTNLKDQALSKCKELTSRFMYGRPCVVALSIDRDYQAERLGQTCGLPHRAAPTAEVISNAYSDHQNLLPGPASKGVTPVCQIYCDGLKAELIKIKARVAPR